MKKQRAAVTTGYNAETVLHTKGKWLIDTSASNYPYVAQTLHRLVNSGQDTLV